MLLGLVLCLIATNATAQQFCLNKIAIPAQDTLCIVQDSARLFFPSGHERFTAFYHKLSEQLLHQSNRINILHIGGSHVQAGIIGEQLRQDLSAMGDSVGKYHCDKADRGLVFPFKAVRTNAPSNYDFEHTGYWRASRCISASPDATLGISGIAAMTTDSTSSLTLRLYDKGYEFDQLRLLGYCDIPATRPIIVMDNDTILPQPDDNKTGFLFNLPAPTNQCTLKFVNLDQNSPFVVRGLLPMSKRNGITYTESGVNGASTSSWLKCKAFDEELSLLPPDMVVFGIGINDAATSFAGFNPEVFKDNYKQIIDNILKINPNAALLFITNNDCNQTVRMRKPNTNTSRVAQAFKELAAEYNGAVFNLYQMMGGQGSAATWERHNLMRRDRVHFTGKGYQLVGDLIYNAIVNDFETYANEQKAN